MDISAVEKEKGNAAFKEARQVGQHPLGLGLPKQSSNKQSSSSYTSAGEGAAGALAFGIARLWNREQNDHGEGAPRDGGKFPVGSSRNCLLY